MSSLLKIETERLQKDIDSINEQISYIKKYVSQMRSAEQQLEAMWEGTAKITFREQFESDCQELNEIVKLIEDYRTKLLTAKREYLMANDNVSSIIKSIRI